MPSEAAAPDDFDDDLDDDDIGTTVLEDAFLLYRDSGLRIPPVPRELVDALEEQAEWLFATEQRDITDREGFLALARDPAARHVVGFGHVGHGVASWYLCYNLILDPLAVFVRQSYGSIYDDEATTQSRRAFANHTAARLEELIVAADAARAEGRLPAPQRMIVVIDDRDDSGWEVAGGTGGWHATDEPLPEAMTALA